MSLYIGQRRIWQRLWAYSAWCSRPGCDWKGGESFWRRRAIRSAARHVDRSGHPLRGA